MKYKNADVFFDSSGGLPAQHMYFVNTDYFELGVHRDANMTVMDELRSVNQDAVVIPSCGWQPTVLQPLAPGRAENLKENEHVCSDYSDRWNAAFQRLVRSRHHAASAASMVVMAVDPFGGPANSSM